MRRSNVRQHPTSVGGPPQGHASSGSRPRSKSGSRVRFGEYPNPVVPNSRPFTAGGADRATSSVGRTQDPPSPDETAKSQDLETQLQNEQLYLNMLDAQVSKQRHEQGRTQSLQEELHARQDSSQELRELLEKSTHRQSSLDKLNQLLLSPEPVEQPVSAAGAALRRHGLAMHDRCGSALCLAVPCTLLPLTSMLMTTLMMDSLTAHGCFDSDTNIQQHSWQTEPAHFSGAVTHREHQSSPPKPQLLLSETARARSQSQSPPQQHQVAAPSTQRFAADFRMHSPQPSTVSSPAQQSRLAGSGPSAFAEAFRSIRVESSPPVAQAQRSWSSSLKTAAHSPAVKHPPESPILNPRSPSTSSEQALQSIILAKNAELDTVKQELQQQKALAEECSNTNAELLQLAALAMGNQQSPADVAAQQADAAADKAELSKLKTQLAAQLPSAAVWADKDAELEQLRLSLPAKDAELKQLRLKLHEEDVFVTLQLAEESASLEQMRAQLEQLPALQAAVADKDAQLRAALAAATDKDAQLRAALAAATDKDAQLRAARQAATDKDAQLRAALAAATDKDAQLRAALQAATDKDAQLRAVLQAATDEDAQLPALQAAIADKDAQLEQLKRQLTVQQFASADAAERAAARDGKLELLKTALNDQVPQLQHDSAQKETQMLQLKAALIEQEHARAEGDAAKEAEMVQLRAQLRDCQSRLNDSQSRLEDCSSEYLADVVSRDSELSQLTAEHAAVGAQLEDLKLEVAEYLPKVQEAALKEAELEKLRAQLAAEERDRAGEWAIQDEELEGLRQQLAEQQKASLNEWETKDSEIEQLRQALEREHTAANNSAEEFSGRDTELLQLKTVLMEQQATTEREWAARDAELVQLRSALAAERAEQLADKDAELVQLRATLESEESTRASEWSAKDAELVLLRTELADQQALLEQKYQLHDVLISPVQLLQQMPAQLVSSTVQTSPRTPTAGKSGDALLEACEANAELVELRAQMVAKRAGVIAKLEGCTKVAAEAFMASLLPNRGSDHCSKHMLMEALKAQLESEPRLSLFVEKVSSLGGMVLQEEGMLIDHDVYHQALIDWQNSQARIQVPTPRSTPRRRRPASAQRSRSGTPTRGGLSQASARSSPKPIRKSLNQIYSPPFTHIDYARSTRSSSRSSGRAGLPHAAERSRSQSVSSPYSAAASQLTVRLTPSPQDKSGQVTDLLHELAAKDAELEQLKAQLAERLPDLQQWAHRDAELVQLRLQLAAKAADAKELADMQQQLAELREELTETKPCVLQEDASAEVAELQRQIGEMKCAIEDGVRARANERDSLEQTKEKQAHKEEELLKLWAQVTQESSLPKELLQKKTEEVEKLREQLEQLQTSTAEVSQHSAVTASSPPVAKEVCDFALVKQVAEDVFTAVDVEETTFAPKKELEAMLTKAAESTPSITPFLLQLSAVGDMVVDLDMYNEILTKWALTQAHVDELAAKDAELALLKSASAGNVSQKRLDGLKQQLSETVESKDAELAEMKTQLTKAQSKGATKLSSAESELQASKDLLEEQFSEIAKYVETVEKSTTHNNELQVELTSMRAELEEAQAEVAQLSSRVLSDNEADELSVLKRELAQECAEHEASKGLLQEQFTESTNLTDERKRVCDAFDQANESLSAKDGEIDQLGLKLRESQESCRRGEDKVAELQALLAQKEEELCQANSKLEALLVKAQEKLDLTRGSNKAEMSQLRDRLASQGDELNEMRSRSSSVADEPKPVEESKEERMQRRMNKLEAASVRRMSEDKASPSKSPSSHASVLEKAEKAKAKAAELRANIRQNY